MDKFGVPKKINRHVLSALYYLKESGFENPQRSAIIKFVEHTIKNTVPVENFHHVVRESLYNMAHLGVIGTNGLHYFVRDAVCFQSADMDNIRRNEQNKLNPNSRKRVSSEDFLSGNEIYKIRKRIRGNKSINMNGEFVELPKAKNVPQINLNGISLLDEEDSRTENDKSENDVHLGTKDRFISQPIEIRQDQTEDLKINHVIESSEQQSNSDDQQEHCEEKHTVTGNEEVKTSDDQHVEVENNSKQEEDNATNLDANT